MTIVAFLMHLLPVYKKILCRYIGCKTSHTSNIHSSMETFFVGNGSEIAIPFLSGTTMGEVDIEFEYDDPFLCNGILLSIPYFSYKLFKSACLC
jgi:hypothetical protein